MPRSAHPDLMHRLSDFLDPTDGAGLAERLFNALLVVLILLTVTLTIVGTVPSVEREYGAAIRAFDYVCAAVFGAEYLARLYVTPLRPGYGSRPADYWRYATAPLPLIDLVVLLSLLIPGSAALASLRGLRLLKLLSLLKLGRYSDSLLLIGRVIAQRAGELLTTVLIVIVLVFIAASVLYQVEAEAGTKGFESIPQALWWAVVTLTTTGYGDVYPATPLGKAAAGLIMLFGVGMVALPAGMVASGFAEELARLRQEEQAAARSMRYCPHCGEPLE
ncbi:ion transporter [Deinococcus multiflagellatus]|uniref:Ion transporter n=1 Tax=Deinococcus multiflagellatus TaxID=1656887 RepID=A0ABW1ZGC9_9DEIO|nr:ion transporter [Deinococcus multiflagellatus]MBZ9714530.1 ion transporter [Deinococcus multiflagellatus]